MNRIIKAWEYNHFIGRVQTTFVEEGTRLRRYNPRKKKFLWREASELLYDLEWLAAMLAIDKKGATLDYFKKKEKTHV